MLASISGSLIGTDWALDDNEAGSGNALYPDFMARVRAEEANRATYGIRVLHDPHGLYTSAARFEVDSICGDGYAERYRGMVDVITAGFPCQPFSIAGKRAGEDDPRNMWPATIECIRVVRPRFALLENVPGLLSSGYFGTILGDLAESGYDARWRILSAAELGAPHKRDRLWIAVTDATSGCTGNTTSAGLSDGVNGEMGGGTQGLEIVQSQRPDWWAVEPAVGRVAHGLASRVDRLKAIGNGQVPAVVRAAWLLLGGER